MNWFERNILNIYRFEDNECYAIRLFGIFIDFRQWYVYGDYVKGDPWFFKDECEKWIQKEEKRNAKRKVKKEIPTYSKVPWIRSIVNWNDIKNKLRKPLYFALGVLLGYLLGLIL